MTCIVHYPNWSTYTKSKPLSETYKCPTYLFIYLLIYWPFSCQIRLADRRYLIAYYTHGSISRKMSKLSDTKCKNKYGKIKKKKTETYTRQFRKTNLKQDCAHGITSFPSTLKH